MLKKISELEVGEIFKAEDCIFRIYKRETPRAIWTRVMDSTADYMKPGHHIFMVFQSEEEMVEVING